MAEDKSPAETTTDTEAATDVKASASPTKGGNPGRDLESSDEHDDTRTRELQQQLDELRDSLDRINTEKKKIISDRDEAKRKARELVTQLTSAEQEKLKAKGDVEGLERSYQESIEALKAELAGKVEAEATRAAAAEARVRELTVMKEFMSVGQSRFVDPAIAWEVFGKNFQLDADGDQERIVYQENGQTVFKGGKALGIEEAIGRILEKHPSQARNQRLPGTGSTPQSPTTRDGGTQPTTWADIQAMPDQGKAWMSEPSNRKTLETILMRDGRNALGG